MIVIGMIGMISFWGNIHVLSPFFLLRAAKTFFGLNVEKDLLEAGSGLL